MALQFLCKKTAMLIENSKNIDTKTVIDFGAEWQQFDQTAMSATEAQKIFNDYFKMFPQNLLNQQTIGADIGCGSGRWAKIIAPKVAKLYCIDASKMALSVAKKNLHSLTNAEFIEASVDQIPLADASLDFAYSLGVLHHIPDTLAGIKACVSKLKPGAPFLVYLYYAFDNKPKWFRLLWKASDYLRKIISKLPFKIKLFITQIIALTVYWPLARTALIAEYLKLNVDNFPLSIYRHQSFYTMRTDALDRFGTKLEHRFTKKEIIDMLKDAGLTNIEVNSGAPYWCAIGYIPHHPLKDIDYHQKNPLPNPVH
jgi:ubiquinone/menaquinone biosynthesis C-methylase UbiE